MSRKYLIQISLICKYQKQLAEVVIDKKETNEFSEHIFLSLERKSIFENKMVDLVLVIIQIQLRLWAKNL